MTLIGINKDVGLSLCQSVNESLSGVFRFGVNYLPTEQFFGAERIFFTLILDRALFS